MPIHHAFVNLLFGMGWQNVGQYPGTALTGTVLTGTVLTGTKVVAFKTNYLK